MVLRMNNYISYPQDVSINFIKTPDDTGYSVGDIVTFTITISNVSGIDISTVILTDNIPDEATFIPNSLTLDGVSVSGYSYLNTGLLIGDMINGDYHIVTYQITIDSIPATNPVSNNAIINYDYVDPTGANQIGTLASTTTLFSVTPGVGNSGNPIMTLTKTPDKTMHSVGNIVTFTIVVSNTGGEDARDVVLTDNIPNEATFIPTSLTLNGGTAQGANFLTNGLMIGYMSVGDSHTVTYQIILNRMPAVNPVINNPDINYDYLDFTGSLQIGSLVGTTTPFRVVVGGSGSLDPTMTLTKVPDKTIHGVGNVVTFTIVITNTGGEDATSVILTDNIPNEATFITSSLTLNGVSVPSANFLNTGLMVGDVSIGDSHTVTYQMVINRMPAVNPVINNPDINYDYRDSTGATQIGSLIGKTTPFRVISGVNGNETPIMKLTKTPNQIMYMVDNTVTFTIVITNTGGEDATAVILTDNVPNEATFITSSLKLDGVSVSGLNFLNSGLVIDDVKIGDSHTVTYDMTINSMPATNPVLNNPSINFDYVDSTGAIKTGTLVGTTTPFTVISNTPNGCCCCCCCCCHGICPKSNY